MHFEDGSVIAPIYAMSNPMLMNWPDGLHQSMNVCFSTPLCVSVNTSWTAGIWSPDSRAELHTKATFSCAVAAAHRFSADAAIEAASFKLHGKLCIDRIKQWGLCLLPNWFCQVFSCKLAHGILRYQCFSSTVPWKIIQFLLIGLKRYNNVAKRLKSKQFFQATVKVFLSCLN